jgi:hypothetical protein
MENKRTLAHGVIASKGFGETKDGKGKELAQKAAAISHEKRRKRRAAKDILLDILHSDSTDKELSALANNKGIEPTELATLLLNMTKRAGKSANMAELVFKLTGDLEQAPQQNITIVNQLSDEQLQRQINELRGNDDIIDVTPEPPDLIE